METAKRWVGFVRLLGKRFFEDRCPQWAASLSYTTILSLVPLIAVSFSLLASSRPAADRVRSLLLQHLLPNSELVEKIPEYLSQFSRNAVTLGVASVLFLIVVTMSLFNTVESALISIWGVSRQRSFLSRFSAYWTTVTLTPLLLTVSAAMTAQITALPVVGTLLKIPLAERFLYVLLSLALSVGGFSFLYLMIPRNRVRVGDALWGALAAGILFEGAKAGFGLYVSKFASFTRIYGTLGTIPVFMVWIYLFWIIVLLGAQISFLCSGSFSEAEEEGDEAEEGYSHYYGVRLLVQVGRAFDGGAGPVRLEELAHGAGISTRQARSLLDRLKTHGLVAEVEEGDSYVMARPPQRVRLQEVVDSVGEGVLTVPPRSDGRQEADIEVVFSRGREAVAGALTGVTVADLLKGKDL